MELASVAPVRFKRNIMSLSSKLKQLTAAESDVQRLIDLALKNNELVRETVIAWMARATTVRLEVSEFIHEAQLSSSSSSSLIKGWFTSSRFSLARKAKLKILVINGLLAEWSEFGNTVSDPKPAQTLMLAAGDTYVFFPSQYFTTLDIFEAMRNDEIGLVGMYGMPGVGKTLLIAKISELFKVDQWEVVMVTISQNPDLRKIQDNVATELDLKLDEKESITLRARRLSQRLLNATNVVIVLDDLWERLELTEVGIPFQNNNNNSKGCKVIITTRDQSVCDQMGTHVKIEVGVLSEQDSLILFRRTVGDVVDSQNLETIARDILNECKGLPLAIVTLGRALRGKDAKNWESALVQLKKSIYYENTSPVISSVRLSFDFLGDETTKICFLFCCLFPESFKIDIEVLLKYVMGEKLLKNVDSIEEARQRLHVIIEKLMSSSLLFYDEEDHMHIRMHDVFRDAAISIAAEEGYEFMVKAGMNVREWPDKELHQCKRLSLMGTRISWKLPSQVYAPQLLSLSLNSYKFLIELPPNFFVEMNNLLVLDLSDTDIESLPPSLSYLVKIRTLLLKACRNLKCPSPIEKLETLEILDLSESNIRRFPEEMGRLINLKLLDLSNIRTFETVPSEVISSLCRLEELRVDYNFKGLEIEVVGDGRKDSSSQMEWNPITSGDILKGHALEKLKDYDFKGLENEEVRDGRNASSSLTEQDHRTASIAIKGHVLQKVEDYDSEATEMEGMGDGRKASSPVTEWNLVAAGDNMKRDVFDEIEDHDLKEPEDEEMGDGRRASSSVTGWNLITAGDVAEQDVLAKVEDYDIKGPDIEGMGDGRKTTSSGTEWNPITAGDIIKQDVLRKIEIEGVGGGKASSSITEWNPITAGIDMKQDVLQKLVEILKSSQDTSFDKETLWGCLEFCCLFPENYEFDENDIIQLWMAGGLVPPVPKSVLMEEAVGVYFKEFVSNSFFLYSRFDFLTGRPRYKLNHSIFHLITEQHSDEYSRIDSIQTANISENTLHSSILCNDIEQRTFDQLYLCKRLRSLLLLPEHGCSIEKIPRDLFMELQLLRALDVSCTNITELPSSVGNLKDLEYLNLSGTCIKTLPESLCRLCQLQTLKLKDCLELVDLPKGTKNLINLRHLDLDVACQLIKMPPGLGELTQLQTLPSFIVGRENGCHISELKNMMNLRGTLCISRLENVSSLEEAKEAALGDKKHLNKLELQWSELEYGLELLENLQPPENLQELQVIGYGSAKFPSWMGNPSFFFPKVITIHECRNCELLPPLGKLRSLETLCISEMHEVKAIDDQFCGRNKDIETSRKEWNDSESLFVLQEDKLEVFPRLVSLTLSGLPNWEQWTGIEEGDFPCLHKLNISDCPKLVALPELSFLISLQLLEISVCSVLKSLPKKGLPTLLHTLLIVDCPLLKRRCRKEGRDWGKIAHIPNVWIDYQQLSGPELSVSLDQVEISNKIDAGSLDGLSSNDTSMARIGELESSEEGCADGTTISQELHPS